MKLTLEKGDLVKLLSKAFGYSIAEEDVTVQSDPFEVHIQKVDTRALSQQKAVTTPGPTGNEVAEGMCDTLEDPTEDAPPNEDPPEENVPLTLEDIMSQSAELATNKEKVAGPTSKLARALGQYESEEAPEVTDAELASSRGGGF